MKIQHNIKSLNAHRSLATNRSSEEKNLQKLASGYRINRASDDAAGLNISEGMRAQITGLDQAYNNAMDGIALVQTMEGAMEEIHSMMNRMVELTVQAGNGTYSDQNRQTMQDEIDDMVDEIGRIEENTTYNGISILQGPLAGDKDGTLLFQVAENSLGSSQLRIEIPDMRLEKLGISNVSVRTANEARASLSRIESGIDYVSAERGKVGAYYNRLEYTGNNLREISTNMSASESRIRDANMAKEEMHRMKNDILGESAQAMLAQANQDPEGVLQLLQ